MAEPRPLPRRAQAAVLLGVEQPRGSHAAAATRAASFYGTASLVVQGVTLVVYVVLARLAGPEAFGIFAAAMIVVGVGTLFAESGMLAALVHRRDRIGEAASTATVATLLAGAGLGALALALAPAVAVFFDSRTTGLVAAAAAGILVFNGAAIVPSALLQRRLAVLGRQLSEFLAILSMGAVAIAGLVAGLGVWALLLGSYAFAIARTVSLWTAARWWPDTKLVSFSMWRELVGYGRHVLLGSALAEVGRVFSTALVGRLLGPVALGHFRLGLRLVTQGGAPLLLSASYVLLPAFSEIGADDERFRQALLRSLRVLSLVAFPVGLLFVPLGVPLAVVLLGEAWRPAGHVMMALAGVVIALTLISISSDAFKARRRPDLLPRVHAVGAALPVALMLALVPFDAVGIAAAMSIGALGAAAYALHLLATLCQVRLRDLVACLAPPAVAASAMAASLLVLDRVLLDAAERPTIVGAAVMAAEGLAGLALYLGLLWSTTPGSRADLRAIWRALLRRDRSGTAGAAAQPVLPVDSRGAP